MMNLINRKWLIETMGFLFAFDYFVLVSIRKLLTIGDRAQPTY